MSFRDRDWDSRVTHLGDQAEGVFERTYPQGFVRFGLNRPPISLKDVPPFIRYTPDYLTSKGLVEVQGFGRDATFKLKTEKLHALTIWHEFFRVDLFVYDSHQKRYGWIRLPEVREHIERGKAQVKQFTEGKLYFAIPATTLPVIEWLEDGEALGVKR